jgi:hypothetical protein
MRPFSRRTILKAAAGLVAFIPVARELAKAPLAAADCGCGDPPPIQGPPPPGYQICDAVRVLIDEEYCLQNEDGSWTIYYDQKLIDAFYDIDCTDWYLFNTGIPCPAAY